MISKIPDRRKKFRQGLHPLYLPMYDALCGILGPNWQPISGHRSIEEQAKLYAQGRTTDGLIVTEARPGSSMHNYGLASDWGYFSDPLKGLWVNMAPNDKRWKEYHDACDKVGVRLIEWEKPHNEFPLSFPVSRLQKAWLLGGKEAVEEALKELG